MTAARLLADTLIQGWILLAAGYAVAGLLRGFPAAVRHVLWIGALAAVPTMAVVADRVPSWWPSLLGAVASTPVVGGLDATAAAQDWGWWCWAAGAVLVAWRAAASWLGLHREAGAYGIERSSWWRAAVDDAARIAGVRRRVRVVRGPRSAVPVTWGVVHPTILLPSDADGWPAPLRRSVLLHELAHVRRLDALSLIVARVVCVVLWFHPAVWIMARRARFECELACDEATVQGGVSPEQYGRALFTLATSRRSAARPVAALSAAAAPALEMRIARLADPRFGSLARETSPWLWLGLVGAAVLVAASFARVPTAPSPGPPPLGVAAPEPIPGAGPGSFRTELAPRLHRLVAPR